MFFCNCFQSITHLGLRYFFAQYEKAQEDATHALPCLFTFTRTMGIPCSHRIAAWLVAGKRPPPSDFNAFWHFPACSKSAAAHPHPRACAGASNGKNAAEAREAGKSASDSPGKSASAQGSRPIFDPLVVYRRRKGSRQTSSIVPGCNTSTRQGLCAFEVAA